MLPAWFFWVLSVGTLGLILGAQVFWYRCFRSLVARLHSRGLRVVLAALLFTPLALVWVVYVAGFISFLTAMFLDQGTPRGLLVFLHTLRRPEVTVPAGLWSISSALSFLVIKLLQGAGWLAARLRPAAADPVNPERRHLLQTAAYVAGAVPFALVAYGFLERRRYRIEEVSLPLANLPPELDGVRLVQLTDVHASGYMPVEEVERVVAMASELDADLVFHTGDFITSRGDPLDATIDALARVRSRYGLYGCLGNHEIYAGAEARATRRFAERGCRILRGQAQVVEMRGARLNLIGVDYQRQVRGRDPEEYRDRFLPGIETLVRRDMPNILLTHNPNPFLRAADLGIELTLAGHTHGGQVQVEILDSRWSPARFITRFISGLYDLPSGVSPAGSTGRWSPVAGRCLLYVSRGIGTIAMPIRIGAPPEISLLTLRRG